MPLPVSGKKSFRSRIYADFVEVFRKNWKCSGSEQRLRDGSGNQNGWIFGKIPNGLWPRPPPHFRKIMFQIFFGKRPEKKNIIKVHDLQHNFLNWKWPPKEDWITTEKAPSLSKSRAMARIVHSSLVWRTGGIEGLGQSQFPAWHPPRQPPWQPLPLSQCGARWALWFEDSVETSEAFEVDVTFDLRNGSSSKKKWLLFYCCGDHAAFDFGAGNWDHFKLMMIYITFNLALNRKYEIIKPFSMMKWALGEPIFVWRPMKCSLSHGSTFIVEKSHFVLWNKNKKHGANTILRSSIVITFFYCAKILLEWRGKSLIPLC